MVFIYLESNIMHLSLAVAHGKLTGVRCIRAPFLSLIQSLSASYNPLMLQFRNSAQRPAAAYWTSDTPRGIVSQLLSTA